MCIGDELEGTVAKKATRKRTAAKTTAAKTRKRPAAAKRRTPSAKKAPRSAAAVAVRGTLAKAAAKVAAKVPWGTGEPDAIELLEREHRRFEDLMKQGEETTERAAATRRKLLKTITAELNAHEAMEEKVLYPALKSHPAARDIVLEGYEEHHVADLIVKELQKVATDGERWAAKFKVLKESIEHHIQEEEGEMFRTARGIFSRDELQELALRMLEVRKRAVMK